MDRVGRAAQAQQVRDEQGKVAWFLLAIGKAVGPDAVSLAGGQGSLRSPRPLLTVGSYWPYATTLFDYVRRAMPFNAPQSLTAEELYSVTGYVLHLNGLLPADAVVDAASLAALRMPNRDGFRPTAEGR